MVRGPMNLIKGVRSACAAACRRARVANMATVREMRVSELTATDDDVTDDDPRDWKLCAGQFEARGATEGKSYAESD